MPLWDASSGRIDPFPHILLHDPQHLYDFLHLSIDSVHFLQQLVGLLVVVFQSGVDSQRRTEFWVQFINTFCQIISLWVITRLLERPAAVSRNILGPFHRSFTFFATSHCGVRDLVRDVIGELIIHKVPFGVYLLLLCKSRIQKSQGIWVNGVCGNAIGSSLARQ